MTLATEIEAARKNVVTDGYDMSLGEIINLYRDEELVIDPVFQRLFRWDDERKTRFIESIILGIPIPSIFVYQDKDGIWELVDGVQRISTLLQLTGDLKGERAEELGELILNGTRFLPSLSGKKWKQTNDTSDDGLPTSLQIEIKRARVRVEILKAESDISAKFELFQRLNTGGSKLSEQEVRNSMAISLNPVFQTWLSEKAKRKDFVETTNQTKNALDSEVGTELALRFFAYRNFKYQSGLDVHEYLDEALLHLAKDEDFDHNAEGAAFDETFQFLNEALGDKAFKKWDGTAFKGMFLSSVFEVLSIAVSLKLDRLRALELAARNQLIVDTAKGLWANEIFIKNSGAGVRGTTRLTNLLPLARTLF